MQELHILFFKETERGQYGIHKTTSQTGDCVFGYFNIILDDVSRITSNVAGCYFDCDYRLFELLFKT